MGPQKLIRLLMLTNALVAFAPCFAGSPVGTTVGATYSIEEKDAQQEMKERAGMVNWRKLFSGDPDHWSGWRSLSLPAAKLARKRFYKPLYTLAFDIPDKNGRILYPKGFRFNPLSYVTFPLRVVVIGGGKRHLAWAKTMLLPNDMVITAGGDPRALGEALGRPVFLFDPRMKERLGLATVPSVVQQQGDSLMIQEFVVKAGGRS